MKRLIVVLAVVALLWPGVGQTQQMQQTPQETRSMTSEFALSWLTPILNLVYFPVKFSVGTVGAVLGGVSGWATGGNERAAEGIWRPMTGGTYFFTPQTFDSEHEQPFLPFDGGPYEQQEAGQAPLGSTSMYP